MTEREKVQYKGKTRLKVREPSGVPGTACLILREKKIKKEMKTRRRRCWGEGRKRWVQSGKGCPIQHNS